MGCDLGFRWYVTQRHQHQAGDAHDWIFKGCEKLSLINVHADCTSVSRSLKPLGDLSLGCYRPLSPACPTAVSCFPGLLNL